MPLRKPQPVQTTEKPKPKPRKPAVVIGTSVSSSVSVSSSNSNDDQEAKQSLDTPISTADLLRRHRLRLFQARKRFY